MADELLNDEDYPEVLEEMLKDELDDYESPSDQDIEIEREKYLSKEEQEKMSRG